MLGCTPVTIRDGNTCSSFWCRITTGEIEDLKPPLEGGFNREHVHTLLEPAQDVSVDQRCGVVFPVDHDARAESGHAKEVSVRCPSVIFAVHAGHESSLAQAPAC